MKKTNLFTTFKRSKAMPLILIMLVMLVITVILSSDILKGAPIGNIFKKGFLARNNLVNLEYKLVLQIFFLCGLGSILISGNIDLSAAGQATLCSMVFAWICRGYAAIPWGVAALIALALAVVLGLINAFLVNKLHFPSFIATIGMSSIYRGLCNIMTKGNNINVARQGFLFLGDKKFFGNYVPMAFIIALVVLIVFQFILSQTKFGRGIYMIGGNLQAARLSGLNPDRYRTILFIIHAVMACIGGLFYTSQSKMAAPTGVLDSGLDMTAISGAILGGVAFTGGAGSLACGFVGLLLLNVFSNMLIVMSFPTYWTVFATGFVLVVALFIDYISTERQRKALLAASAAAEAAEFGVA